MPRYHAGRVAELLADEHRCPVVFGSATPSVERFFDAEDADRTTLLTLPFRAADAQLPTVSIADLGAGYRAHQPSILGPELFVRMGQTLERKQQAILFLNRRAYAPFVMCRACGERSMCPNCAVSLSFHRGDGRLKCHHCGFTQRVPEACPNCGSDRISPFGIGTEKVEEAVAEAFPQARVARLDRDVASKKGALEDILARFRSGDIDVLVGTQMVAKGLDFPNVTLVGVIAADISLNVPDFRSEERTFQLLSQVAGRAGRGRAPGFVVIQTFNPEHPAVTAAADHDFTRFYEQQIRERREANYPPFVRLVNVVLSGESRTAVVAASREVADRLQFVDGILLGPVDCPIERLQTRYRRHVLLKLPPSASVADVGAALLGFRPADVSIAVDVDPQSLM
jgi:primosomal protein N' (replication factor Y)